jgi:two-component system chemotaxis sensor kinase CheA
LQSGSCTAHKIIREVGDNRHGRRTIEATPAAPTEAVDAAESASETTPEMQLPEIQTLDDAAAFFMQLSPQEPRALTHLRDALKSLVTTGELPTEVKKVVIKAGKATEQLLKGQAADPTETWAEMGRLLSEAALAYEFARDEKPAAPPVNAVANVAPTSEPVPPIAPPITTNTEFTLLPADPDLALLGEFVAESCEYMEGAEAALLALENDPDDLESVNTVFRAFHTIKGTAAFLGLEQLAGLAHRAESLLSRMRDREIRCAGGYADLALRAADTLKEITEFCPAGVAGRAAEKTSSV